MAFFCAICTLICVPISYIIRIGPDISIDCLKGDKMSATTTIKQRLVDLKMTQLDLAVLAGMTKQNLNNKLARDNFTAKELEHLCGLLGLKIMAVSIDGKEYPIDYGSTVGLINIFSQPAQTPGEYSN